MTGGNNFLSLEECNWKRSGDVFVPIFSSISVVIVSFNLIRWASVELHQRYAYEYSEFKSLSASAD